MGRGCDRVVNSRFLRYQSRMVSVATPGDKGNVSDVFSHEVVFSRVWLKGIQSLKDAL